MKNKNLSSPTTLSTKVLNNYNLLSFFFPEENNTAQREFLFIYAYQKHMAHSALFIAFTI